MVSKAEHDEMCCVYAGLVLFDDKVEITADKLNKVIAASGNAVESYYPEFFAKYFKSVDLDKLLQNVGSPSAAPATAAAPADAKKDDKKDDKKGGKKEAPKKKEPEPEPEEDEDVGFGGLF